MFHGNMLISVARGETCVFPLSPLKDEALRITSMTAQIHMKTTKELQQKDEALIYLLLFRQTNISCLPIV